VAVYTTVTFLESKGRVLPTIGGLAAALELNRVTVSQALKELARLGLITLERQHRCEIVTLLDVVTPLPEGAVKTGRNVKSFDKKAAKAAKSVNSFDTSSLFEEKRRHVKSFDMSCQIISHIKNCATDRKALKNHHMSASRPVENSPIGYKDKNKYIYRAGTPKNRTEEAQWNLKTFYQRLKVIRASDAANQESEH